ncbi:Serine hydroxymethyltransferase [Streptomyces badius]
MTPSSACPCRWAATSRTAGTSRPPGAGSACVRYGVRRDTGLIDLDEVRDLALAERPRLIFCGGTAVPRTIDFAGFAEIARETGAVLVADIAHIAGLIAGGAHPSPAGHADVVSTTTHKTLRGPRGAMLLSTAEHARAIDRAVFPGLQGGPHNQTTAAIAVALGEAATAGLSTPTRSWPTPAPWQELAARGFDLVSGGTDNHLLLIDLTDKDVPGKTAAKALDRAGIVVNYNTVPYDTRKPFDPSGIRIGTPALTSRGVPASAMGTVATWITTAVEAARTGDENAIRKVRGEVKEPWTPTRHRDCRSATRDSARLLHLFSARPTPLCGTVDRLDHPGVRASRVGGNSMRLRTAAASAVLVLCATAGLAACSSSPGTAEADGRPATGPASVKELAENIEAGTLQTGPPELNEQSVAGPEKCARSAADIPAECAVDPSFAEVTEGERAAEPPTLP